MYTCEICGKTGKAQMSHIVDGLENRPLGWIELVNLLGEARTTGIFCSFACMKEYRDTSIGVEK